MEGKENFDTSTDSHEFEDQEKNSPPTQMNALTYQPSNMIQTPTDREKQLRRERTLERTYSVSGSISRARAPIKAKVAAEFRTLSINLTENRINEKVSKNSKKVTKGELPSSSQLSRLSFTVNYYSHDSPKRLPLTEIYDLDWHEITSSEALTRLGTSVSQGLDDNQVKRRQAQDGPNSFSKPPNRWARKIFGYVFGGFGSLLLGGSIICFIAWKPLGNPSEYRERTRVAGSLA